VSLSEGTRLGVYEITGQIGAGGMGEVYRATDTKLDREVAIKILPAALASDSDRLARFEREAKLLAALNHPHIAAVHNLDEHDGMLYLAMELVEGETLEEKLKASAVPVEDALLLALQIAEALEAAHGKNVIHRDLKPANVMVNADGQVKVLDFGLAKAFSNEPEEASPGKSPALSLAMTQQGIILGTAGYMSPEQASGQPTDQRADVWAFGVVLYEMLTGLPLFSGESVPHILADVLRKEPEWDRLPKNLHPRLKLMFERCLTKKPRNRYHSIADARVDIQAAISDPEGALAAQLAAAEPATARRLSRLHLAGGIVAAAIVFGVGAWMLKPAPPRAPVPIVYGTDALPAGTFLNTLGRNAVSISRDGDRYIIRSALERGIYLRMFDDPELRVISGTEGVPRGSTIIAPDGQSIVYASSDGLRRHSVSGGASVPLAAIGSNPFGMSWTDDGYILYSTGSEISRVPENGGEPEVLIQIDAGQAQSPAQLPDGDWILYAIMDTTGRTAEESEIVIESPSTGERRTLRTGATDVRYTASGHLVYLFNGTLYAVPFDIDRLEISGGAVPVVVGVNSSVTGLGAFDISESGNLVYIPGSAITSVSSVEIVTADIDGNRVPTNLASAAYRHVRSSPDGRFLAIDSANSGEDAIVWLYDSSGASAIRRLTFDGNNLYPVWSPDSEYVAFQSDRDGDLAVFRQRIDGTGGAERLTMPADGEAHIPESWSPDGQFLTFSVRVDDAYTLWVLSLEDMSISRFSDIESTEPIGSVISPDGQWIAYHSLPVGASATNFTSGIYVEPFPATGARYQAPKVLRDFQPFWAPDGSALHYIGSTGVGQLATVAVNTESGFTFGAPVLTPFDLTAGRLSGDTRGFDALPDGRFVGPVFAENAGGTIAPEVRYVINWVEELKRLVPTA